jgi:pentatricopeptide repeat protein
LILAYAEHDKGKEALILYEEMQNQGVKPNNQTVTCILKACCESGLIDDAAEIFLSMQHKLGFKPDEYHYNCMLTACANNGLLSLGKRIHNHIIESKQIGNIVLRANLINMYGKCGCLEEAIEIFNSIEVSDRDIIACSTMILAYGQNGRGKEAVSLFEKCKKKAYYLMKQLLLVF